MIRMTERDYEIIALVDTLKVLDATQIERLFFKTQQAQSKRCLELYNHKKLKRLRKDNWSPYIYYVNRKPAQLVSMLAISEFYVKCIESGLEVIDIEREVSIQVAEDFIIRPDAVITIKHENREFEYWVEVDNMKELSTNKYYKAMKEYKFIPPTVISVSNRKRRNVPAELDLIKLKLDLSDFDNFLQMF